ncbi:trehalase-like domain-containing protein [Candidatus Aeolococcus gillhamiae]|uniref:trehalase-like domain-containing protein n=1 Tax=Candidatus Aeolococcus gillhamiae TaxID=3127015 RepID=UPI003312FA1D
MRVGSDTAGDPDIGAQRLLSNGKSLALLAPSGQVTCWCAPEPDSPPLLWRLVGPGGSAATWVGCTADATPGILAGPQRGSCRTALAGG